MSEQILPPVLGDPITRDGVPNEQFYLFLVQLAEAAKPPVTGSGSPEGVLVSTSGRWYVNTAASVGSGIYFKQSGEGNTGWVLRS